MTERDLPKLPDGWMWDTSGAADLPISIKPKCGEAPCYWINRDNELVVGGSSYVAEYVDLDIVRALLAAHDAKAQEG